MPLDLIFCPLCVGCDAGVFCILIEHTYIFACMHVSACVCMYTHIHMQSMAPCSGARVVSDSVWCIFFLFLFLFLLLLWRVCVYVCATSRGHLLGQAPVAASTARRVSHRLNRMKLSQLSLPHTHHTAVGRCLCVCVCGVGGVKRLIFYLLRCQRTAAAEPTVHLVFAC